MSLEARVADSARKPHSVDVLAVFGLERDLDAFVGRLEFDAQLVDRAERCVRQKRLDLGLDGQRLRVAGVAERHQVVKRLSKLGAQLHAVSDRVDVLDCLSVCLEQLVVGALDVCEFPERPDFVSDRELDLVERLFERLNFVVQQLLVVRDGRELSLSAQRVLERLDHAARCEVGFDEQRDLASVSDARADDLERVPLFDDLADDLRRHLFAEPVLDASLEEAAVAWKHHESCDFS